MVGERRRLRFRFGIFELDEAHFELRRGGERVAVQPKVFGLLSFASARADNPFVGRGSVLEFLRGVLDDVVGGGGRVVLLSGEAGIGKTRTAEELLRSAGERGALVLAGHCVEVEGAPAYWPPSGRRARAHGHDGGKPAVLPGARAGVARGSRPSTGNGSARPRRAPVCGAPSSSGSAGSHQRVAACSSSPRSSGGSSRWGCCCTSPAR
jgi:hypothetical protein